MSNRTKGSNPSELSTMSTKGAIAQGKIADKASEKLLSLKEEMRAKLLAEIDACASLEDLVKLSAKKTLDSSITRPVAMSKAIKDNTIDSKIVLSKDDLLKHADSIYTGATGSESNVKRMKSAYRTVRSILTFFDMMPSFSSQDDEIDDDEIDDEGEKDEK